VRLSLALIAMSLVSCGGRGSLVVVDVEATPPITAIAAVHATVSALGTTRDFDLSPSASTLSTPFTFGIDLPPSASGTISLHVSCSSASGVKLGEGDGSGTIAQGDTAMVTVNIGGGVADLSMPLDSATGDLSSTDLAQPIPDLEGAKICVYDTSHYDTDNCLYAP
jgi:hypothetical protein